MNIILIMSDTFRRDALKCCGFTLAQTPRLDQFAQESFVFDNVFCGSSPTIPNRFDIMSGRFTFIDHEWCRLPPDTVTVQQISSASGFTTMLIADNAHMVEDGYNYCRGFNGWEWIRGQESDLWYTSPGNVQLPSGGAKKNRGAKIRLPNIIRNSSWWQGEEDRHAPRTIKTACRWLELNQEQDQFFLWLDLFDPHEPWDAPQHYLDLYEVEYHGEEIPYPRYDFWKDFMSQEELGHCRALYLAEVSMVDRWIGVLLDKVSELGMTEDTAIIFTSDHGFLFGEHGLIGKSRIVDTEDGKQQIEGSRLYHDIRSNPLLIRLPGHLGGKHLSVLLQSPDLMPTILELAGLATTQVIDGEAKLQALQCGMFMTDQWQFRPQTLHGKSLLPLLRGETQFRRDIAVSSFSLIHHTPVLAKSAVVTSDGWCLHYAGCYQESNVKAKMFIQAVMDPNDARIPCGPALFDLKNDPTEEHDVIGSNMELAAEIHGRYVKWLEEIGAPEAHLDGCRRLS